MLAARAARFALSLASLSALVGCDDLKDFRGQYSGLIVEGNFVRSCFGPGTRADLSFDPDQAIAGAGATGLPPNTLSTSDGTFNATPLEPIGGLPHDPLSQLDFPGPDRLRNYLLIARPTSGALAGRDALVVISLLASESVEIRIIARTADGQVPCDAGEGTSESVDPATPHEYFGLFRLKR